MPDPKLLLLKFDSEVCGPCIAMNKKGVLDDLVKAHSNLTLVTLTIADKEGEVPPGSSYDAAYDLSEPETGYDVQSTPTVVVITDEGFEVARVEAPVMRHSDAEKLYDEAVKNAAEAESEKALMRRVRAFIEKYGAEKKIAK